MTTDAENTNSEKIPYIKYYRCTFTDSTNTCVESIREDFIFKEQIINAVLLPETDARVQRYLRPHAQPEELYVQYITLSSIEDLFRLADVYDGFIPKPIYRG